MRLPRNAQIWAKPYLKQRFKALRLGARKIARVWVCLADHYEPMWHNADISTAQARVAKWRQQWPEIAASSPKDSSGGPPQYTFFYPQEEYRPELLEPLAEMARQGIADVEVHIHHGKEGRQEFIRRIRSFCHVLREQHGLLRERDGQVRFGFIHGNWALDNSLPNGEHCGLNDEIKILRDLGCYADFTMPSGDSPSQSRMLNSIYWCVDDPERPKSYDQGNLLAPGGPTGDLMMITGPFGLRWADRWVPRMETGELAAQDPPSLYRTRRWFELAPMVGEDVFIKLYTHGAQEKNLLSLLGDQLSDLFRFLELETQRNQCRMFYVTAWEMFQALDAIQQRRDPCQAIVRMVQSSGTNPVGFASR